MAVIQITPGTSTVAKFKTEFCNLRDYGTSRTERQVNAFFMSSSSFAHPSSSDEGMPCQRLGASLGRGKCLIFPQRGVLNFNNRRFTKYKITLFSWKQRKQEKKINTNSKKTYISLFAECFLLYFKKDSIPHKTTHSLLIITYDIR